MSAVEHELDALLERAVTRLAGAPHTVDLACDHPRRRAIAAVPLTLERELSPTLIADLTRAAHAWNVAGADVACAAWIDLLARYARQDELLFVENFHAEAQRAVVRVQRDDAQSVLAWVRRVAEERQAAERALPYPRLVQAIGARREPGRAALCQLAFGDGALAIGEEDLGLCFEPGRVRITYRSELFERASIERLTGHLLRLLTSMLAQPDAPLRTLSLLDADERRALIEDFNPLQSAVAGPCLHRWVEQRAAERPDAIAVSCAGRTLSYRELDRRASQLAYRLRQTGVARDVLVGVCMERSLELIVALLGILKAGGAYLPLEPSNPPDRLAFVLEDAQAALVITHNETCSRLPATTPRMRLDALSDLDPEPELTESSDETDALAYVIYTSGSTGQPKGCLIEHRAVVRLFTSSARAYGFGADDVWTMFHSVAFDFSVWEIWGALIYGGRLVVVPYTVSRSPDDFYRLCADEHVTVLNQTPSAFRQLIAAEARLGVQPLALRYVIFGGEALEFECLRPWFARHGDQRPTLVNMYGITETTVHVTQRVVRLHDLDGPATSAIGVPLPDLSLYVLDAQQNLLPIGVPGEIYVAGPGVARGYLNRPELSAERFSDCPFRTGARMYRSGDLARRLPNGELDYLGRIDSQVKVRGFRIETGELENVLRRSRLVEDVAVVACKVDEDTELVAYVVSAASTAELRAAVRARLPEYMLPAAFVALPSIPLNANGKVDRKALPAHSRPRAEHTPPASTPVPSAPAVASASPRAKDCERERAAQGPARALEAQIASAWREVLGLQSVGLDEPFFDLGGNSLRVVALANVLRERLGRPVPVAQLFQHLTIRSLAAALERDGPRASSTHRSGFEPDEPIAIVGMAGRFPGAPDLEAFWCNLRDGIESVTHFAPDELDASVPLADRQRPEYVPARPMLVGAELFDAGFFGIPAGEAALIDPQQRVLLELAWQALEDAGCDPARYDGEIGVWAGEYSVDYYTRNVLSRPDVIAKHGAFLAMLGNEKDFVATRIAHRLDLRGPAISVHTACSTSLVAVVQAFHALRSQQCDVALAGGVSIAFPQRKGHLYDEGGMLSADGHCRPFAAEATGTMFGDGAGMVVLKRLSRARADGDRIYAVLRGAAINNDGGHKLSFSAPTVDGQAAVIGRALAMAGVAADAIDYVEAHGTATPLGDPIEVEALQQAFRAHTDARQFCALGSVKSNIGHLTAAAGIAGLIKTVLALHHEQLPKTLHYERPNPRIDFANSPFVVLAEPRAWPRGERVRRAGVSSFGVGGTNAHVIVEEAPQTEGGTRTRASELLVVSARTDAELAEQVARVATRCEGLAAEPQQRSGLTPHVCVRDLAFTLATGRRAFAERCTAVVPTSGAPSELRAAAEALRKSVVGRSARVPRERRPVAFVFPGQGAQHVGMGRHLHETEPAFRDAFDQVLALASGALGRDLRAAVFATSNDEAHALLRQTELAQPALFAVSYALSQLYQAHGVRPDWLIGHSVGEFVAATLAGVMRLEDAVALVVARGRAMQALPGGSMLAVRAPADALALHLCADPKLALAAVNGPKLCVVAGPEDAVKQLAERLAATDVAVHRLHTSHAFHSPMMDGAIAPLLERLRGVALAAPRIPIVSTVTGERLGDEQARDPHYWATQLRQPVQFMAAVQHTWRESPRCVLVEVGPRGALAPLMRQIGAELGSSVLAREDAEPPRVLASLDARTGPAERSTWLSALGQLWTWGAPVALAGLHREPAQHVGLPSYPFQRQRYFIDPPPPEPLAAMPAEPTTRFASSLTQSGRIADSGLLEEQLGLMERQLQLLANT